jgi:cytochrome c biogenesis protein CcmG/thiol:disulfide interchange protein DsbE
MSAEPLTDVERHALAQHRQWALRRDLPSQLGTLLLMAVLVLWKGPQLIGGFDQPVVWWLTVAAGVAVVGVAAWWQVNRLMLLDEALRTGATTLVSGTAHRRRETVRISRQTFQLGAGQMALVRDGETVALTLAGRTGLVLRIDGKSAIDLPGMPRPILPPEAVPEPVGTWRRLWQAWGTTALVVLGLLIVWRLGLVPSLGGETAYVGAEQTEAMDFRRPRVDGQGEVALSRWRGRVVLVNFWATWCPPCRMEIPDLASVHRRYQGQGFEIVGVALDREGADVVRAFAAEHAIPYPVVMGDGELITGYGGIRAVPTSFLIDRQGRLAKKYVGLLTAPRLERDLAALLK